MTRDEIILQLAQKVALQYIAEGMSGEYEEVEQKAKTDVEKEFKHHVFVEGNTIFDFIPGHGSGVIERRMLRLP